MNSNIGLSTGLFAVKVLVLAMTSVGAHAQSAVCMTDSDPDGDGWGWEDGQSCRVAEGDSAAGETSGGLPVCLDANSDSDGDGWGWENNQSCRVGAASGDEGDAESGGVVYCASAASDPDGDGWGWENEQSCRVGGGADPVAGTDDTDGTTGSVPQCASAASDPDGDGWGWENDQSCLVAAGGDTPGTDVDPEPESDSDLIDIYNAVFTARSADCADYANTFDATVVDIKNSLTFNADLQISASDSTCTFVSNSVPNHDFNDESASFAGGAEGATIAEVDLVVSVTRDPQVAAEPTFISQEIKNAIFLNGVRLDIIAAGCYRPNSPDALEDGNVGRGCASDDPWVLDPLGFDGSFGVDMNNGHTQPGGLYHYHGSPNAMFDDNPGPDGSPVIGFAADGFPIYGGYFYDARSGQVRKAMSGYTLKTGSRGVRSNTNPGGDYDGTYNDDWEFTGAGDLDQCNGMTVDGQYGYYVTDTYPWVIRCFSGTPHESFRITGR